MRKKPHIPKLGSALVKAGKVARSIAESTVRDFARTQRDRFVERIEAQDFPSFQVVFYPESGTNLSPRWLARKAAKGADDRTMIATGHYIAQIRVFRKTVGKSLRFRVGFHPSVRARNLDGQTVPATLDLVARVLEHGSQKMRIPPRPHWEPHLKLMQKEAVKVRLTTARRIVKAIKTAVPLLGGLP